MNILDPADIMVKIKFQAYEVSYTAIILVLMIYFWIILKYTAFMPVEDDYSAVLAFLNTWLAPDTSPVEKYKMLFYLNADHRLVFANLVILLHYYLFDQANFLYLVLVGNAGWFLTLYLLWYYSKNNSVSLVRFVPVVFMILAFSHASLMTWATGSLQQYWQLFFALFSIWLLIRRYEIYALIVMTMAIFAGGGGFTLIPLFLLYLLVQKSWRYLGISFIVSILIVWFYFIVLDYKSLDHNIALLIERPLDVILFFLTFLGNFMTVYPWAAYVGGILIFLYIWMAKYLFGKMPFIAWSVLYILMTALLVSVMRVEQGLAFALPSRYAIYSVLLLALVYLGYITRYQNNKVIYYIGLLAGVSLFIFHFIHKLPAFEQRKYVAEAALAFPTKSYAETVLQQSVKRNTFTAWIGKRPSSFLLHLPKAKGSAQCQIDIPTHHISYKDDVNNTSPVNVFPQEQTVLLDGWAFDLTNNSRAYGMILKLQKQQGFFYLDRYRKSANALYGKVYPHNGFHIPVKISHLSPGVHQIEVKVVNTFATAYYDALTIPLYKLKDTEINLLPIQEQQHLLGSIDAVKYEKNRFQMRGWLLQKNSVPIELPVLIDIDGKRYAAHSRIERKDVAREFKNPSALYAGIEVTIPEIQLSKGRHKITVLVGSEDRKSLLKTGLQTDLKVP